jgi:hypothetical protein
VGENANPKPREIASGSEQSSALLQIEGEHHLP